jgi:catalase (peroxidase I)
MKTADKSAGQCPFNHIVAAWTKVINLDRFDLKG